MTPTLRKKIFAAKMKARVRLAAVDAKTWYTYPTAKGSYFDTL